MSRSKPKSAALPPHPLQPIYIDEQGTARFRENAIVSYLLEEGGIDLNRIASLGLSNRFSVEDQEQFAQLIGYSLVGFHELSYVRDETALAASTASGGHKGCRDTGCVIHTHALQGDDS